MYVSTPVRIALGAGILGGTALLLAACGHDKQDAAGGSTPQPGTSHEPAPSSGQSSTPVGHEPEPKPDSSYRCVSRSYELPGYTVGTARSLASSLGGGNVRLSVQDAEFGWKYVTASACGPSDQANANLDDYDAAIRRTIADVR